MASKKDMESSSFVLLTGAGFTYDFGGFLGAEIWAVILNQIQVSRSKTLRNLMLSDDYLNYENVYDVVLRSSLSKQEKSDFEKAIQNAYAELDQVVSRFPLSASGKMSRFLLEFTTMDKSTTCLR
jgi:hypothetical protein